MCLQQGCGLASELQKRHRKNKEQDRGKEEQPHEDDPSSHVSPTEGSIQGSSPLVSYHGYSSFENVSLINSGSLVFF